jgi:hypothetical protein
LVLPDDWPEDLHLRKDAMDNACVPSQQSKLKPMSSSMSRRIAVLLGPLHMTR